MSVIEKPKASDLKWTHYTPRASPPSGDTNDAHTAPLYEVPEKSVVGVKEAGQFRFKKVDVIVTPDKTRTWFVKGKESAKLLEHERGHWMMQLVVGKEMERALLVLRATSQSTLEAKMTAEFDWYRTVRGGDLDKKYDDATKHGADPAAQKTWATKIQGWYLKGSIDLITPR